MKSADNADVMIAIYDTELSFNLTVSTTKVTY
jgi:hypothetical protein